MASAPARRCAPKVELLLGAARATPRPSGALWLPEPRLLVVADLHLGKSERLARRGGPLLPPYEAEETLARLEQEIQRLAPRVVLSLGDAFDDAQAAANLPPWIRERIAALTAGRRWIWVAGNHDPRPSGLEGEHLAEFALSNLIFRHAPSETVSGCEVAGHLHPKAVIATRGRRLSRRCFLADRRRVILPAFGAYTGGLDAADPAFDRLLGQDAQAILLSGGGLHVLPRPRGGRG